MSFSYNPQQSLHSGPLMSSELKNVQEQLAQMMQQNSKLKGKKADDYSISPSREQNDDEFSEPRYSQVIQNSQNIPDEGLVSQTQNLMQDIIKVMKDQELNNQLQILTDQEISKPVSNFDLKNMINRMHSGISTEQQRLQFGRNSNDESRNNISLYQSSVFNKSANFGKSKSKSPALSSRTQTIIRKKQMQGEYKPIYERLDEIKQHHQEIVMRTTRMFPKKVEPTPTFQPQINKNTQKIMPNKQRLGQNWDEFLKDMRDWDEKKVSQIRQKQVEKANQTKQTHTFHPVINPSTSTILERSEVFGNDYCPQNMQNVVNRLYSRMKEKKQRDKERLQECMSHSPFKPKINQNSEKLFFKMCNGAKIPFEERIKQKTPQAKNSSRNLTPNQKRNNQSTLDPIKENEKPDFSQNNNNNNGSIKSQDVLNKSLLLQNSTYSIKASFSLKDGNIQNNSALNQSVLLTKGINTQRDQFSLSNSSFLNGNSNTNMNNQHQSPEQQKKSFAVNSSQSISLPKNKEKERNKISERNSSNKSLLQQRQTSEQHKENSYHILITDGDNHYNQSQLITQPEDTKLKKNINNKSIHSPALNQSILESNKMLSPGQKNPNNSSIFMQSQQGAFLLNNQIQQSACKLNQSINLSANKNTSSRANPQKNDDQNLSPAKTALNLSYNIRSPKLNHSPLKKSAINYTMTVQNMKAQKDNLSSASKFEVLNTQISPLKDLNNQNEVEYGQNLKYIINLLRKEDPSFLQSAQKGLEQNQQQQQQQQQQQSGKRSDQKQFKSPIKKK